MINEWHKGIIFLLQVSDLAIRDPMQRDTVLELF